MIHCHLKMSVIISHKHTFYFIDTLLNNLILVVYLMQEITVFFFVSESSVAVQRLRLGSVVPKDQDLHGAAQALIR